MMFFGSLAKLKQQQNPLKTGGKCSNINVS